MMSKCCICGTEGEFKNNDLTDEFPSALCDKCSWNIYLAKKDKESSENREYIAKLTSQKEADPTAADYLRQMFGLATIAAVKAKKAQLKKETERVAAVVKSMPVTSSNGFEGYHIVRYGGYVSGDEVVALDDSWITMLIEGKAYSKDQINDSIKKVRQIAIQEMKEAAALMDCNAVIALDFDYITIDRHVGNANFTHIILTANGTAVEIEPA